MANCLVENCTAVAHAKGLCQVHYSRVKRYGRTATIIAAKGSGTFNGQGYKVHKTAGKLIYAHRTQAEKALGKPLPAKAVVHHHYGNPSTLVICPDQAYHMLLHKRMRALRG